MRRHYFMKPALVGVLCRVIVLCVTAVPLDTQAIPGIDNAVPKPPREGLFQTSAEHLLSAGDRSS